MFNRRDRCYIIAEIGGNFTTYEQAVALIDAAKRSRVDCIKLQTFTAETIVTKKAFFDMESTGRIRQYDYFKQFEISHDLHREIVQYIATTGLDWFSTPSHISDLEMLLGLGMKAVKVGADDANNYPLLKEIARTGLWVVLSTGMCTMDEVREAVNIMLAEGDGNLVLLHTVSGYPTYANYVNLNVLNTYRREFPDLHIGFSDHTLSPLASIAAATMGANVIERHFTLDRNAVGPDHMISSTPDEMQYIVESIREIEKMKGTGLKMPVGPEIQNRLNNRKSIVTLCTISPGDELTAENIAIKRPGSGIEPHYYAQVLGKRACRKLETDELLAWGDFN